MHNYDLFIPALSKKVRDNDRSFQPDKLGATSKFRIAHTTIHVPESANHNEFVAIVAIDPKVTRSSRWTQERVSSQENYMLTPSQVLGLAKIKESSAIALMHSCEGYVSFRYITREMVREIRRIGTPLVGASHPGTLLEDYTDLQEIAGAYALESYV